MQKQWPKQENDIPNTNQQNKKTKAGNTENEDERITRIVNQLTEEGAIKSKYFWKLRKKLLQKDTEK